MHNPTPSATRGRIELSKLSKQFPDHTGVSNLDLTVGSGEFFTILGPSGCGKTTTLMLLAGFAEPDAGGVSIDGRDLAGLTPQARELGIVFQNYALFPHMSVAQNLAFPLEVRGRSRAEIEQRVSAALALVQLTNPDALPEQLSGGQQQRVAIARALIFDPPVLLMDEPLGALDRNLRLHLQGELKRLQRRLGITVVYVTHDQEEAMSMSDRIAILNQGKVEQVGTPVELYERPATLFVADFLGDNNIFSGQVELGNSVRLSNGALIDIGRHRFRPDTALTLAIRPERVAISTDIAAAPLRGKIIESTFMGRYYEYRIAIDGAAFIMARVINDGRHAAFVAGQAVGLTFCSHDWQAFAGS